VSGGTRHAQTEREMNTFSLEILKRRDFLEHIGVDGKVIRIFRDRVGRYGLDSSRSGCGPIAGCCEQGNRSVSTINGRNFTT
jgi:hypothetical protein